MQKLAAKGDTLCMLTLSVAYAISWFGVKQDKLAALRYYQELTAAKANYVGSECIPLYLDLTDDDESKKAAAIKKLRALFKNRTNNQHDFAIQMLAACYQSGFCVRKNRKKAFDCFMVLSDTACQGTWVKEMIAREQFIAPYLEEWREEPDLDKPEDDEYQNSPFFETDLLCSVYATAYDPSDQFIPLSMTALRRSLTTAKILLAVAKMDLLIDPKDLIAELFKDKCEDVVATLISKSPLSDNYDFVHSRYDDAPQVAAIDYVEFPLPSTLCSYAERLFKYIQTNDDAKTAFLMYMY